MLERWFGLKPAQKLPLLRYFTGAAAVLDRKLLDNHDEDITLQQWLYMLITLLLPLAGLVMTAGGVLAIASRKFRTQS